MTRKEKMIFLNDKIKNNQKINIAFLDPVMYNNIRGSNIKNKTHPFKNYISKDDRFNVITLKSQFKLYKLYNTFDLVVPPLQYKTYEYCNSNKIKKDFIDNKRIINIRYSLGWHKVIQYRTYSYSYMNFTDGKDVGHYSFDVYTGHPWSEYLNKPKEEFADLWETTNKKRILICPHHTIENSFQLYGNSSDFLHYFTDLLNIIDKYKNEVEFVVRPHPNLYYYIENMDKYIKLSDTIFNQIIKSLSILKETGTLTCEDDYVDWFKYSDAMIHDCGSFRCEYLYMNKPVCYIANDINMDPRIWSQMGKDAIDCHELIWSNRGESLDKFIRNVLDGKDEKKDLREQYYEKYCSPNSYPNGKTPCENIVNAILGQEEYKDLIIE